MKQDPALQSGESKNSTRRIGKQPFWRIFWLTFLVVSLAYAWYCFYVPGNEITWAESYEVAEQRSAASGKPIVLYFTGTWCVPCRIMKRQVWADDEVAALVNDQFIPVAIDVGNGENEEILKRFHIEGAPVTIVCDSTGNALGWRAGGIDKGEFLQLLKSPAPPEE